MNCCICTAPINGEGVTLKMSRPLRGDITANDVREPTELGQVLATIPTVTVLHTLYVYEFHRGSCELRLAHRAHWHKRPNADCQDCKHEAAAFEIRKLSEDAKSLICHRIMNPLCIASGYGRLIVSENADPRGQAIVDATSRISNELMDLLGVGI